MQESLRQLLQRNFPTVLPVSVPRPGNGFRGRSRGQHLAGRSVRDAPRVAHTVAVAA